MRNTERDSEKQGDIFEKVESREAQKCNIRATGLNLSFLVLLYTRISFVLALSSLYMF